MILRVDNSLDWMLVELSVLQSAMTWSRNFVLLHVPDSPLEWLEGAKRSGIDRAFPIFRQKCDSEASAVVFAVSVFLHFNFFLFRCLTCRLFEFAVMDVHSLTCASVFILFRCVSFAFTLWRLWPTIYVVRRFVWLALRLGLRRLVNAFLRGGYCCAVWSVPIDKYW